MNKVDENKLKEVIGKRLFELRDKTVYTQAYVAEKLHIEPDCYGKTERGVRKITFPELIVISDLFDTTIDYIITGKELTVDESIINMCSDLSDSQKKLVVDYIDMVKKKGY